MKELPEKLHELVEECKWINAGFMIEAQGNDKEHTKKALETLIENLKKEKDIEIYDLNYDDIIEMKEKEGWYSALVEVRVIAKNFSRIIHVALFYSPSAFEVYDPNEIKVSLGECQGIMNDIASVVTAMAHTVFVQKGQLQQLLANTENADNNTKDNSKKSASKNKKNAT